MPDQQNLPDPKSAIIRVQGVDSDEERELLETLLTQRYPEFRGEVAQFDPSVQGVRSFWCKGRQLVLRPHELRT